MELQSLEQLSYIGEIIASFAVVISLIYLAFQVKQNTSSLRMQTVHQLSSHYVEAQASLAHDKDLCEIYHRGVFKFDELDPLEQMRFSFKLASFLRIFDELHFQYGEGSLDRSVWNGMNSVVNDMIRFQGFRAVWNLRGHQYSREFQDYINRMLETGPAGKTSMYPDLER